MLRGTVNAVCMCLPETRLEGQDAAWHCECRMHVPTRGKAQTLNKQSATIDTIYVHTVLSTPAEKIRKNGVIWGNR